MKDVLLPIGTIVTVENVNDEEENFLIIGRRCINHYSMKPWDYISVPYPDGLKRVFDSSKKFDYDDYFYFNHYSILDIVNDKEVDKSV